MLMRAAQMESELREKMRGGVGTVKITHMFQTGLPQKCRLLATITLEPSCSVGFHNHEGETEIYYFMKGNGTVDDHGDIKEVGPGDAMLTGGGEGHSVKNTGENILEFVAVIILD